MGTLACLLVFLHNHMVSAYLEDHDVVGLQIGLDRFAVSHRPVQVNHEAARSLLVALDLSRSEWRHHSGTPAVGGRGQAYTHAGPPEHERATRHTKTDRQMEPTTATSLSRRRKSGDALFGPSP